MSRCHGCSVQRREHVPWLSSARRSPPLGGEGRRQDRHRQASLGPSRGCSPSADAGESRANSWGGCLGQKSLFSVTPAESSENGLLHLSSRGRFSVVKKCDQKGTKRAVATKFVNKKLMKRDQVTHELRILQNLQHPLLVGLLDTFETSTSYVLVLEMCVRASCLSSF